MAAEIITKEDLQEFGKRLLNQMKALINGGSNEEPRKFLKSYQVKNLLKISNIRGRQRGEGLEARTLNQADGTFF